MVAEIAIVGDAIDTIGMGVTPPQAARKIAHKRYCNANLVFMNFCNEAPNGLRYLRWGGDGEAVQLEKS